MSGTTIIKSGCLARHTLISWAQRTLLLGFLAVYGCASPPLSPASTSHARQGADLFVVDCLLPGRVKKLGRQMTFLTPRQPIKTSAQDCEIRGGEYISYDRSNYATALKVWLPQAKAGNQEAQTYVGEIYEKGLGLAPDYEVAAVWYRKAAAQGHTRAQINLGHLYEKGLGVKRNGQLAIHWYRQASGLSEAISLDARTIRWSVDGQDTQAEMQALRQEVAQWKQKSATYQLELERSQQELDQRRQELERRQSELTTEQHQLQQARQELEQRKQDATVHDNTDLQDLASQLSQREADLEKHRRKVRQLQQALSTLERDATQRQLETSQLANYRQALEQSRMVLDSQRREFEREQHQLEQAQQTFEQRKRDAIARDQIELQKLEEQLQQREAKLSQQRQEMSQLQQTLSDLEGEVQQRQTEILQLQKQSGVSMAPPTIEIIDPPLVKTRGLVLARVSPTIMGQRRTIVGRVVSPAGVLILTINDHPETLDPQGLFRVSIPVQPEAVPVHVVVVDKSGKRASVKFRLMAATTAATAVATKPPAEPALDFGTYHALIIGNKRYTNWPSLNTPEADAKRAAKLLSAKYSFKIHLLLNATRFDILQRLNILRKELTDKDNLLIYYAGHGHWEKKIKRGYWVPIDGDLDSNVNWISTIAITDILNAMSAGHILVVADSCYSGALTRSALARLEAGQSKQARQHWLKVMIKKRSRTVLSSGDLQPVLDSGGGKHSVFAKAFLDVLDHNEEILSGQHMHNQVSARVAYAALAEMVEQNPQYAPIRFAGHESGDFLFVPKHISSGG